MTATPETQTIVVLKQDGFAQKIKAFFQRKQRKAFQAKLHRYRAVASSQAA